MNLLWSLSSDPDISLFVSNFLCIYTPIGSRGAADSYVGDVEGGYGGEEYVDLDLIQDEMEEFAQDAQRAHGG
jgi:hypothetical protein